MTILMNRLEAIEARIKAADPSSLPIVTDAFRRTESDLFRNAYEDLALLAEMARAFVDSNPRMLEDILQILTSDKEPLVT